MRVAQVRSMLWMVTGVAAVGAVMAIAVAATLPFGSTTETQASSTMHGLKDGTGEKAAPIPPLASFEAAWSLPLRRPLVDAPPAPSIVAAAAQAKPAGLAVRLVGTIVDGHRPRGVFMIGLSKLDLKGVGDAVGGARVVAIDNNSATLSYDGETVVLHREKKPFDPSGESYNAAALPPPPVNDQNVPASGG